MLKKIFGTTLTRVLSAVLSFVLLLLNAKLLGAEGVGTISLIVLGITILQLLTSFAGGASLIYILPRSNLSTCLLISYLWTVLICLASIIATLFLPVFSVTQNWHIILLSFISSLTNVNLSVILSQEKIMRYNLINLSQTVVLFFSCLFSYFYIHSISVDAVIICMYVSYGTAFLLSLNVFDTKFHKVLFTDFLLTAKQLLHYGFFIQMANFIQLFNYRLSYYMVDFYLGRASVGIFSTAIQISEAIWIVGRSIAVVLYSRITNSTDITYSKLLTIKLTKLSLILSLLALFVLLCIPTSIFIQFFGLKFRYIPNVIQFLGLGIITMTFSFTLSSFFSAIGKPHFNTINSLLAFFANLLVGFFLIPKYGVNGAALTNSLSYFIGSMYLIVIFLRKYDNRFGVFIPNKLEIIEIRKLIAGFKNKTNPNS